MPPGCLPLDIFGHIKLGGGPGTDPHFSGGIMYLCPGKCLRIPQEELKNVGRERNI